MVTPFNDSGNIDHQKLWDLARHLSEQGSDGLVVTGTTGESPTLSDEEKLAAYGTVVEAVKERDTIVVAGTGTYDTAHSVALSEEAQRLGVDAIMAVTPYYSRPSQQGLVGHFTTVANATDLPLLVYNIPARTGRLIEVATLAALSEHPQIVATKDAVMDVEFTSKTVRYVPDLAVYSGQDSYTLPMMVAGAVGVVSVISHLAGPQVAAMVKGAVSNDFVAARRLHLALLPLCEACFLEPNPGPVKLALGRLWESCGDVRLPLTNPSEETIAAVMTAANV